jgi:hypothetical protein
MTRTYTKEKDVKLEVKKMLDKHGYFWWMPPANGYGKAGVSDFNALKDGVFIAIEAKFGTNKPSPQQKAFCQSVLAESGFAFVVNEKNIALLETWMFAFERATKATAAGKKPSDEDGALMLDCIKALTDGIA